MRWRGKRTRRLAAGLGVLMIALLGAMLDRREPIESDPARQLVGAWHIETVCYPLRQWGRVTFEPIGADTGQAWFGRYPMRWRIETGDGEAYLRLLDDRSDIVAGAHKITAISGPYPQATRIELNCGAGRTLLTREP
jgi:hypothetical protein